ncbi:MAG: threonine synthase [Methanobacteriota archaeon]|nr:MAG: threonine synthase [Euryarchaeota archaeon]
MKRNFAGVKCTKCGSDAPVGSPLSCCDGCGGQLKVVMDIEGMKEHVTRETLDDRRLRGVWRYRDILPVINPKAIISLGEGNTNLLRSESLAQILGMKRLFVKDETTNPSGAFIDRGTTVEISRARSLGYRSASCASSGNLASSMAAYCARGGMNSKAYLPGEIDLGKLYQIVAYGAEIVPVSDRAEANEVLQTLDDETYPVTGRNPFFLEGTKTVAVEIVDQLDWRAPDWIIVPVGSGALLSMVHKGLEEIRQLGLVDEVPTKLIGVQLKGCSPILDRLKGKSSPFSAVSCKFARDIAVPDPCMADEAADAIRDTGGDAVAVAEKEMVECVGVLARNEGIFAEPASASVIAGLRGLLDSGVVDRSDTVVALMTGIGLKDPAVARKIASENRVARSLMSRFEESPVPRRIGDSKLAILRLLSAKADYAYSLRKALADTCGRPMSLVSVYQHLSELVDLGLISVEKHERSPERRMRVFYSLTERGMEFMREQKTE